MRPGGPEAAGHMHERMAQIAAAVPEDCQPAVAGFLSVMAEQLDRAGTVAPLTRAAES